MERASAGGAGIASGEQALTALEQAVHDLAQRGDVPVPPYPAVALRVQEAMGRKDFGLGEVAQLVGADAALAADMLRCANSAMYRRGAGVTNLHQAIMRIGAQQVLRLLLASGLATHAQASGTLLALRRILWIEGLAGAAVCQELARLRNLRAEEAFVVGLLHDFGKIVAATCLESLLEKGKVDGRWTLEAWTALVERLHVPVGRALAARWRLPPGVVDAIAAHHGGEAAKDTGLLEVVKIWDQVLGLLFSRPVVTATELAAVPELRPSEREALVRVLEQVPEFVTSFEATLPPREGPSARIVQPASTLPAGGREVKFGVSLSVARKPRLFTASAIQADGLVLSGDEPVPEKRLLEAKIYSEKPFGLWVLTRLCRAEATGFRVEVQPFALAGTQRESWSELLAGPAA